MPRISFECFVSQLTISEMDPDFVEVTLAYENADILAIFVPTSDISRIRIAQKINLTIATEDHHEKVCGWAIVVEGYASAFEIEDTATEDSPSLGPLVTIWLSRLDITDPEYETPDGVKEFNNPEDPEVTVGIIRMVPELLREFEYGCAVQVVVEPNGLSLVS